MNIHIIYIVLFLFAVVVEYLLMPCIIAISKQKHLMDDPNNRTVHKTPVPRLGGVSFYPIIMTCTFLFNGICVLFFKDSISYDDAEDFVQMQFFGAGMTYLFLIGVADDLVGVRYSVKFIVQAEAACLFPLSGLYLRSLDGLFGITALSPWVGIPLTILIVVYITNAINLIDGVDGLASGLCIFSFVLYAAVFGFLRVPLLYCISICSAGVLAVFFYYNVFGGYQRSRNRIFMGDSGSLTLGFLVSYLFLSLCGNDYNRFTVIEGNGMFVAVSPLIIPLFDVLRVVRGRIRDKVNPFKPDRRHIHHKLLRAGLTPHQTMIVILLLTLYFIGLNFVLSLHTNANIIFLADVISWVIMHLIINHFIMRNYRLHPERRSLYKLNDEETPADIEKRSIFTTV